MKANRRDFITKMGMGGLILPRLSMGEGLQSKPGMSNDNDYSLIGHGEFKYRVDKSWGDQDPVKVPVKDCHEMVMDSKGRIILLTNHVKNNVIIYDRSGKVLDSWTGGWPAAHGLTLHQEGNEDFLYVTDHDLGKVYKTTIDGKVLLTLDFPAETGEYAEGGSDYKPTETAIGPNGDIYVADGYGKSLIIQYSKTGQYIRHFGGLGDGASQFDCCHGICVDDRFGDPTLLITSRSKQEFKRFSLDGEHIETIPVPGCWICRPVIRGSNLYFAVITTKSWWAYDGMVAVLNEKNEVVSLPGGSAPEYENDKLKAPDYDGFTFLNPHDVCVDNDENIYVAQWYSGKTYPVKLERV
jgi:hypothetical protein